MTIKKKVIDNIILNIVYLYTLFTFQINGISSSFQYFAFYGVLFVYILFNHKYLLYLITKSNTKSYVTIILVLTTGMLLMTLISPVLHTTYDFSYLRVIIAIFLNTEKMIFLIIFTLKRVGIEKLKNTFLLRFCYAISLYVCFTIITLIIPEVRVFWMNFILQNSSDLELLKNQYYVSRFGLVGFSGFKETWLCTLGCVICIKLWLQNAKIHLIKDTTIIILLIMCIIGNAFYGRSGLIISFLCLLITLFYWSFIKQKVKWLILIIFLFYGFYLMVNFLRVYNEVFNNWYIWAMTPLNNFLSTGHFNNYSVDNMYSMYFLPELKTILVGDGFYSSPYTNGYYMSTDIGFMRPLLFYGIIGELIGYLIPCISIMLILKKDFDKLFPLLLFIVFILFESKGEMFYMMITFAFSLNLTYTEKREKG